MSSFAYPQLRGTSEVSNSGPRSKCDQVIYEAIAKACEIVVSSRGNHTSGNGSSRFNLQVPEIPQVRSILQAWRLTLHVPIRLDVYYQHEGDRRELLERWCLEYRPASTEHFLQAEGVVTQDPIVQLRHVCKRIVLWLRTLYCWTRLLPAQSLSNNSIKSPVGFSIYVNSERKDDVTDLTQNQGFRWQNQPSSVVSPYGELEWKVIYSTAVQRLVSAPQTLKSVARPIPPTSTAMNQQLTQKGGGRQKMPQSAPAHFATMRPKSFNNYENDDLHENGDTYQNRAQNTYDPARLLRPSTKSSQPSEPESTHRHHHPHSQHLQRRHTSLGQSSASSAVSTPANNAYKNKEDDEPPERVLSGLSLAMMSLDQEEEGTKGAGTGESAANNEKRHAALHQVPPHVLEKQKSQRSVPASGDYGYGYNNHIPWQKIHPSSNNPVVGRSNSSDFWEQNGSNRNLTSSPSPLASTPPSAAFLGGTPPTTSAMPPPRSAAATPPFQTRPAGFVHEPSNRTVFLPPQAEASQAEEPSSNSRPDSIPPQTSLDLLHLSPFQQQAQLTSLVSSFSGTGDGSILHSSAADRSLWSNGLPQNSTKDDDDFYEEDMPFAVEDDSANTTAHNGSPGSSLLHASASVASFAQKCAPSQRLSFFESTSMAASTTQSADDLADQLSEFRSFGASIQGSTGSDGTSTPISLRS